MGNLFNRQKKSRITEQDKAVLQLKQQRDKLEQFQVKMSSELEHLRQLAKQLLASNRKDKAKLLLRKKKYQETTLAKTDIQLDNIEKMVHDIEFAQVQQTVMANLQLGNEALRILNKLMTLDDVERILDETEEAIHYQKEIDQLITGKLTNEDLQDVEDELEQILRESSIGKQLPDVPISLPDVPEDVPQREADPATSQKTAVLAN